MAALPESITIDVVVNMSLVPEDVGGLLTAAVALIEQAREIVRALPEEIGRETPDVLTGAMGRLESQLSTVLLERHLRRART